MTKPTPLARRLPLLLTTDAAACSTLVSGPEPAQIGTTVDEPALGVDDPQEGPMIDVLISTALGTAAAAAATRTAQR